MNDRGSLRRLDRSRDGRPAAPVRIVHLGLGNFFRAHQAWYTDQAPDAADWGIAAFTGRSSDLADTIGDQDGLYTLVVRDPAGDRMYVISSLTAVHGAGDLTELLGYFTSPELAIVTSTVTEAGYVRDESTGGLDLRAAGVQADLGELRTHNPPQALLTAPAKFVAGLAARRAAGLPGITFVPCDNIPENGPMVRRVIEDLAREFDPTLLDWIEANCTFVTTMVDRITPRPTDEDRDAVREQCGVEDPAAVATEPFIEWVLSGDFAAGRPGWDVAGARLVEDIEPFETRKLWLLNGSHSLMAYAATIRGHETVSSAIGDEQVRGWVNDWWDVAARHLPLPAAEVADYRQALLERFGNPRIKHLLAQIAADGSQKIAIRIVPALKADRAEGRMPEGATRVIAAWIAHLRGHGAPVTDARAEEVTSLADGTLPDATGRVLAWLGIKDAEVADVVVRQVGELGGS